MENLGNVIDKSVLRLDYDKLNKNIWSRQVGLSFWHSTSHPKFVTALADLTYYIFLSPVNCV